MFCNLSERICTNSLGNLLDFGSLELDESRIKSIMPNPLEDPEGCFEGMDGRVGCEGVTSRGCSLACTSGSRRYAM